MGIVYGGDEEEGEPLWPYWIQLVLYQGMQAQLWVQSFVGELLMWLSLLPGPMVSLSVLDSPSCQHFQTTNPASSPQFKLLPSLQPSRIKWVTHFSPGPPWLQRSSPQMKYHTLWGSLVLEINWQITHLTQEGKVCQELSTNFPGTERYTYSHY